MGDGNEQVLMVQGDGVAESASDRNTGPYDLVIVVTYRSQAFYASLFELLTAWTAGGGRRAVVVENSADEAIARMVPTTAPGVPGDIVVRVAAQNLGFAPAVNQGLDEARRTWGAPRHVLLVNPDMNMAPEVLTVLSSTLEASPGVGVAGGLLTDESGHLDQGCARRHWNRRRLLAFAAGREELARLLGTPARVRASLPRAVDGMVQVDIVSGALLAVRAEILGEGLDTRLPMYLEDQEVCHRAQLMGYSVVVVPRARALHVGGASRKKNSADVKALRLMELAESPCRSFCDVTGHSRSQAQAVLAAGARLRLATAALARGLFFWRPSIVEWAGEQEQLSRWLLEWSDTPERSWVLAPLNGPPAPGNSLP